MSRIVVAPMETMDEEVLLSVQGSLSAEFGVEVERGLPLGGPASAYDPQRRQYSAPLILKQLLLSAAPGDAKYLAVTACDLFIPMLSFVYGQAQLDGQLAVVSTARLRTEFYGLPRDPALLEIRIRKEAVHEVGHLFGLLHCTGPNCAMALSTNIRQLDLKRPALCAGCLALVREGRPKEQV